MNELKWPTPTSYITAEEADRFCGDSKVMLTEVPKEVADAAMEQARRYLEARFGDKPLPVHPLSQCITILQNVMELPRSHIERRARAVMNADAGLLPKSSGRYVAKLTGEHLFMIMAASALAERVADAPKVVQEILDLPAGGDSGNAACASFFAACLNDQRFVGVEFCAQQSGYSVSLRFAPTDDGEAGQTSVVFANNRGMSGFSKRQFLINSDGVEELRRLWLPERQRQAA